MTTIVRETNLHPDYPLPAVDHPVTAPFWRACREQRLMLQRDRESGAWHWPPKPGRWKGGRLTWAEVSGHGRIHTWVVGAEPFLPAFRELLPHLMVVVQLDEGPRMVGHMVGTKPEEMRFDLPVRIAWKVLNESVTLPVWEPDRPAERVSATT